MKLYLSADIEGTCGIAAWDETEKSKPEYAPFANQMSREVAAACEGANVAGTESILVRDAHDSARNILPGMLPENACIFRGWGREPYAMMSGLDDSFDGAVFTGYHSGAGWASSPLSHTMNLNIHGVRVNGEDCPELMMNCLTASMLGVPTRLVTGDEGICSWFERYVPGAITVPVSRGVGNGSISIHPDKAVRLIRDAAEQAMKLPKESCMFPLPEHFTVEVSYVRHESARRAGWYPGVEQIDDRTVRFSCDAWMDALTFFHFCL